jgi:MFS family permease
MTASTTQVVVEAEGIPSPLDTGKVARKNFWFVQVDGIGVGIANAAAQYLAPFLTLLNATNIEVGLLTSMAGLTGLFLAIPVGRFLQRQRNIVPWYSRARLLYLASYAVSGILPFFVPRQHLVTAILTVWALATLPQVVLNVCFTVVMGAVAGPKGRFRLMSWRWSILGFTTGLSAFIAGRLLDRMDFPINYQVMFIVLSMGGLVSYYFSSQLTIPENKPVIETVKKPLRENFREYSKLLKTKKPFVSFLTKRLVFQFGSWLAIPLFPLYYVRELNASNTWVGNIATAQTIVLMVGYFMWAKVSMRKGSRLVLLLGTLGSAFYPALVASTHHLEMILIYASFASIMQSGIELTFFDELLKTIPAEQSATFVSIAHTMANFANMAAPLVGTVLANIIGIGPALLVSAVLRLLGFSLFLLRK